MRPAGTFGDVRQALCKAAASSPGSVRELATRAQVGFGTAAYTASRMVSDGQLVRLTDSRPAVLGLPDEVPTMAARMEDLRRSFWELGTL
jgi:hypothetical protein